MEHFSENLSTTGDALILQTAHTLIYNIGASRAVNIHAHVRMQKFNCYCSLDNYDILHVQLLRLQPLFVLN